MSVLTTEILLPALSPILTSIHLRECFDVKSIRRCTTFACWAKPTQPERFVCLREHLQKDAELICQNETLTYLKREFPKILEFTAFRGDPFENFKLSMRDVNFAMRENYARMIENVGKNVYPLIVATDAEPDYFGVGGVFNVYLKDGTKKRIVPVNPTFEIAKSLSHIVLGIFSIISPYFSSPASINWIPPLKAFSNKCAEAVFLLENGNTLAEIEKRMTNEQRDLSRNILQRAITYIEGVVEDKFVDYEKYRKFANELAPLIETCMKAAAQAHAEDTIRALQALKRELGEIEWRRAYVIIPTVWPVSLYNIRLQALEKVMSFEQIKSQVLIVEGATSEAHARTTLGRILADRAVAELVWGGLMDESMRDHLFSLQTRRDLLSTTAQEQLNNVCTPVKQNCPFAGRGGSNAKNTGDSNPPATMLRS